jgi:hypothetical protein
MQMQTKWVTPDPSDVRLMDVLNSGLHDELHEDELEDLRVHGKIMSQSSIRQQMTERRRQRYMPDAFPVPVPFDIAATSPVESSAVLADVWFKHNYPKLKPEDLADYYRQHQLDQYAPVVAARGGQIDDYFFQTQRSAVNANVKSVAAKPALVAPAEIAASKPGAQDVTIRAPTPKPVPILKVPTNPAKLNLDLPPQLVLTPTALQQHHQPLPRPVDNGLPKTSVIAMLTMFALVIGGCVGMGVAHPDRVASLLSAKAVLTKVETLFSPSLRN